MRCFVDLAQPRTCAGGTVSVLILCGTAQYLVLALRSDLAKTIFAGGTLVASGVHQQAMLGKRLAFVPKSAGVLPKEITRVTLGTVEGLLLFVGLAAYLFLETHRFSVVHFLFVFLSAGFATRILLNNVTVRYLTLLAIFSQFVTNLT